MTSSQPAPPPATTITLDQVKAHTQLGATFEVLALTTFPEQAGSRRKVIAVLPDRYTAERSDNGRLGQQSWPAGTRFRGIDTATFEYDILADPASNTIIGTCRLRILPNLTCTEQSCWQTATEEENGRPCCPAHAAEFRHATSGQKER